MNMQKTYTASRMESFSDAVLAIIMTIMVLELRPPHGATVTELQSVLPKLLSYILSFLMLIIYWNNHHHLLKTVREPTAKIMWANSHLLFWLSLIPFATAWMGEHYRETTPAAIYASVLLACALAWLPLQRAIISAEGDTPLLSKALGKDLKGKSSPVFYIAAIAAAFVSPWITYALLTVVALIWIIPDRRIESHLKSVEQ
jgi:uncharacterized membrane protein